MLIRLPLQLVLRVTMGFVVVLGMVGTPILCASSSEEIERLVDSYEKDLDRAFQQGRSQLDRFRDQHARTASTSLWKELQASTEQADKEWLAWHILALDPRHIGAQQVFAGSETPSPITEGGQFAPSQAPTAPVNQQLVSLVSDTMHPQQAEVIAQAQPAVRAYSGRTRTPTVSFVRGLERLRNAGQRQYVDPVLAFYFPTHAAQLGMQVTSGGHEWISPPDRYLLEHGLLATEVGINKPMSGTVNLDLATKGFSVSQSASWEAPIPLAHWRLEVVSNDNSKGEATVSPKGTNYGLTLSWNANGDITLKGDGVDAKTNAGKGHHAIQVIVSGGRWALSVDGAVRGSGTLTHRAWRTLSLSANSSALVARLRYLSSHSTVMLSALTGAKAPDPVGSGAPPKPESEPWRGPLANALSTRLDFAFNDVALDEIVAYLNQNTTVKWQLAPSAQALADLPLSLAGSGMSSEQLLNWFKRMAGLDHRLGADGVTLEWR